MPTAAVIGAGPVGCLAALGLHQRGYTVTVYEVRPEEAFTGANLEANDRSINLAISTRGLTALSFIDEALSRTVLDNAVPMRARMIHTSDATGSTGGQNGTDDHDQRVRVESQAYSDKGHCIHSVSRNLLNRLLLDAVFASGISVRWAHKLLGTNLSALSRRKKPGSSSKGAYDAADVCNEVEMVFDSRQTKGLRYSTDLLVGCDGHHSKVRNELGRAIEMDFAQHYIDNYYIQLHMPATASGDFALDPNHLHIWPRLDFMLIALPNQDRTFTCTLFAPKRIYADHLQKTSACLVDFFQAHFPDALDLIGQAALISDLLGKRPSSLATIECRPYHMQGKVIVLGDAAHAMVPFYGQGLNCGLEDVRILLGLIDKHRQVATSMAFGGDEAVDAKEPANLPWHRTHTRVDSGADVASRRGSHSKDDGLEHMQSVQREQAFDEYSSTRHADLVAISQLALQNYLEMSSKVVSTPFLLRKRIDSFLSRHLPNDWWNSLYSLVTFSNLGYHTAQQLEARQTRILNIVGLSSLAALSLSAAVLTHRLATTAGWVA